MEANVGQLRFEICFVLTFHFIQEEIRRFRRQSNAKLRILRGKVLHLGAKCLYFASIPLSKTDQMGIVCVVVIVVYYQVSYMVWAGGSIDMS